MGVYLSFVLFETRIYIYFPIYVIVSAWDVSVCVRKNVRKEEEKEETDDKRKRKGKKGGQRESGWGVCRDNRVPIHCFTMESRRYKWRAVFCAGPCRPQLTQACVNRRKLLDPVTTV